MKVDKVFTVHTMFIKINFHCLLKDVIGLMLTLGITFQFELCSACNMWSETL